MKYCPESYNDETDKTLIERVHEHRRKDINLHIFKHLIEGKHLIVKLHKFTALSACYQGKKNHTKNNILYL